MRCIGVCLASLTEALEETGGREIIWAERVAHEMGISCMWGEVRGREPERTDWVEAGGDQRERPPGSGCEDRSCSQETWRTIEDEPDSNPGFLPQPSPGWLVHDG